MTFRLDDARAIDESRVLLATTFTGHSRRGGVPVVQEQGLVVTVRDGKITRTEAYNSVDEASSAVS
jgi:ketosteroid isomerase-like protein